MATKEEKLVRIRDRLESLRKQEQELSREIKQDEDAKKVSLLSKHKISADELREMIRKKEAEDKQILERKRGTDNESIN